MYATNCPCGEEVYCSRGEAWTWPGLQGGQTGSSGSATVLFARTHKGKGQDNMSLLWRLGISRDKFGQKEIAGRKIFFFMSTLGIWGGNWVDAR